MQQVGAQSFATAQAVDPRHLPVPLSRPARRALVRINHTWVLHRQLIMRGIGAVFALLVAVGAFEARDAMMATGMEKGGRESIEQLAALVAELQSEPAK